MTTTDNKTTPTKAKAAVSKTRSSGKVDAGATPEQKVNSIVRTGGLLAFSPKRLNAPDVLAMDKKDTYWIQSSGGGMIDVITMDSRRSKHNDGFWPFVTGLATDGNGQYKVIYIAIVSPFANHEQTLTLSFSKQGKDKKGVEFVYECNDILELGIPYAFMRRKELNENSRLDNELYDKKNGRYWGRKCLLRVNTQVRTKLERMTTLARLIDVTHKLNKKLRPSASSNMYKIGGDLTPEDVKECLSLDHFIMDEEVNEVMMNHVTDLGPTWAVDNPELAKCFLDPKRHSYPAFALEIGYVNTGTNKAFNLPEDEEDTKCSAEELKKPMTEDDLAKYM